MNVLGFNKRLIKVFILTWSASYYKLIVFKKRLKEELSNILVDSNRTGLFIAYYDLEKKLGGIGASKKTAQLIVEAVKI